MGGAKNVMDRRNFFLTCGYLRVNKQVLFHGLAFVPGKDKCIILAKLLASMKTDEKTSLPEMRLETFTLALEE